MNKDYILKIAESKSKYHRQVAKKTYEEKFNIILALQKIDVEMKKSGKAIDKNSVRYKVWQPEE